MQYIQECTYILKLLCRKAFFFYTSSIPLSFSFSFSFTNLGGDAAVLIVTFCCCHSCTSTTVPVARVCHVRLLLPLSPSCNSLVLSATLSFSPLSFFSPLPIRHRSLVFCTTFVLVVLKWQLLCTREAGTISVFSSFQ